MPTPIPHPFLGTLDTALSSDVFIDGMAAATVDSVATNMPPHIPQGGPFQAPPSNRGRIVAGSPSVSINGKMAARAGDQAIT